MTMSMMTSSNGSIFRVTPFVRGSHRWPVNSHYKGQWREALMSSLVYAWKKNDWLNNRNAHVLRCHRAHYDVTVMGNLGAVVKQDIYTAQKLIWDEPIMYSSVHTKRHEHLLDVVVFVSVRYWLVLTISLKLTSLVLVHHTIAPVPLQHSWIIWVKKSHNSPMNW